MATRLGLTAQEIAETWNEGLRSLNSKLAPIQAPSGVDTRGMERDASIIRVPDAEQQSMYSVLVEMTGGLMSVIHRNNMRIEEQLRAAGVVLPD